MGNDAAALDGRPSRELVSVEGLFDADGYRALSSDIVAHLVFTHQAGMMNLLTRAGWEHAPRIHCCTRRSRPPRERTPALRS